MDARARIQGCLVALALGDALGASVEFWNRSQIERLFGDRGVRELLPWGEHRAGSYTDDTQMTLATARGLLRAARGKVEDPTAPVIEEYVAWRAAQNDPWQRRAPGGSCLRATAELALDSTPRPEAGEGRGCGAVMRMAPAGLVGAEDPFALGCWLGVLTHAHPAGFLSAGCLALIVARLVAGEEIAAAVAAAEAVLSSVRAGEDGWPEMVWWPAARSWRPAPVGIDEGRTLVAEALAKASSLATADLSDADAIESLGGGWVGDEALAIAVLCALRHPGSLIDGLAAAASHGGDSDSTACITGAILGARLGIDAIPAEWLAQLEDRDEIQALGDGLVDVWAQRRAGDPSSAVRPSGQAPARTTHDLVKDDSLPVREEDG